MKALGVIAVVALLSPGQAMTQPYPREFGPVIHMEDWALQAPMGVSVRINSARDRIHNVVYGIAKYTDVNPIVLIRYDRSFNAAAVSHDGQEFLLINLGTLTLLQDRDAFAYVVAHELAHHAKRHTTEGQATTSALVVLGQMLGMVVDAVAARRGYDTGSIGSTIGRGVGTVAALQYSREQEFEADEMAVRLMAQAGFDPEGAVRVQEQMLRQQGDDSFTFLSTHPPTSERLERVREAASTTGYGVSEQSTAHAPSDLDAEVVHCRTLKLSPEALETCISAANGRHPSATLTAQTPNTYEGREKVSPPEPALAVSLQYPIYMSDPGGVVSPGYKLPPPTVTGSPMNALPSVAAKRNAESRWMVNAEGVAKANGCTPPQAAMTSKGAGQELFAIACPNGITLAIRCEFDGCQVVR